MGRFIPVPRKLFFAGLKGSMRWKRERFRLAMRPRANAWLRSLLVGGRVRPCGTEIFNSGGDGGTGQRAAFGARHFQFLIPVDDGSRLKQHRGHESFSQHDQLIVPVNAGFGIEQLMATAAHQRQRIMRRVMEAAGFQFFTQEVTEREAAFEVGVLLGYEDRIALEAIAKWPLLPLVFPGLKKIIRHRIVMDGDEEIGVHGIGPRGPFKQAPEGCSLGDEPNSFFEAGFGKRLHHLIGEVQIVAILGDAARAVGAGLVDGMADIHDDAECRTFTGCGLGRRWSWRRLI